MIKARNHYEIKLMRKSGQISAKALKKALAVIEVGRSEHEIDEIAKQAIYQQGGDLSYKTVPGYQYATCVTVNEQVVHGIPTDRKIENGDLISVDLAASFKGWHTDTAWTVLVGQGDALKRKFLAVGEQALWEGIDQARDGKRVGDISEAIQSRIEGAGFSVVRSLVGHGVGRKLHEDPEIPGFGKKNSGPILKSGMTLAIEVIYTQGGPEVILDADGWTFKTADNSLAGLFEMTVLIRKEEAEVLTDWRRV